MTALLNHFLDGNRDTAFECGPPPRNPTNEPTCVCWQLGEVALESLEVDLSQWPHSLGADAKWSSEPGWRQTTPTVMSWWIALVLTFFSRLRSGGIPVLRDLFIDQQWMLSQHSGDRLSVLANLEAVCKSNSMHPDSFNLVSTS